MSEQIKNTEKESTERLTSITDWSDRWDAGTEGRRVRFNPMTPEFIDVHRHFKRFLPQGENTSTCLEIGAYPGRYLCYFNEFFGYKPTALEYVPECASQLVQNLKVSGVPDAEVLCKDFFELKHDKEQRTWDLVTSFGFVEHFSDTLDVVRRHVECTSPGGHTVILVPNHSGLNGTILKYVDREKFKLHNCMSLEDLTAACTQIENTKIVFSGHLGKAGFWNTGLYPRIYSLPKPVSSALRIPFRLWEILAQKIIPNNRFSSPETVVILQKHQ